MTEENLFELSLNDTTDIKEGDENINGTIDVEFHHPHRDSDNDDLVSSARDLIKEEYKEVLEKYPSLKIEILDVGVWVDDTDGYVDYSIESENADDQIHAMWSYLGLETLRKPCSCGSTLAKFGYEKGTHQVQYIICVGCGRDLV